MPPVRRDKAERLADEELMPWIGRKDPEAFEVFYDRHVCRVIPNPPEVAATFAAMEADPTVYHTMNGPSEFHVVGSLKPWVISTVS